MSRPRDPVVVATNTDPSASGDRSGLADVLILVTDGRAAADQCADLFAACPGLSQAVISGPGGRVDIGFRDGLLLTTHVPEAEVVELATLLYAGWCRGRQ